MKRPPIPPHPEFIRQPQGPFGWLEADLLHDRWLAKLEPDATAVLLLFALAADRRGASFYSRARMADSLGIDVERVDRATERLRQVGLVELRPWRPGLRDGVWQIMPVAKQVTARSGTTTPIADLIRSLGFLAKPTVI